LRTRPRHFDSSGRNGVAVSTEDRNQGSAR
jgi:hypothetical protein